MKDAVSYADAAAWLQENSSIELGETTWFGDKPCTSRACVVVQGGKKHEPKQDSAVLIEHLKLNCHLSLIQLFDCLAIVT